MHQNAAAESFLFPSSAPLLDACLLFKNPYQNPIQRHQEYNAQSFSYAAQRHLQGKTQLVELSGCFDFAPLHVPLSNSGMPDETYVPD